MKSYTWQVFTVGRMNSSTLSVFPSIVCITSTSLPINKGLLQHFYFFSLTIYQEILHLFIRWYKLTEIFEWLCHIQKFRTSQIAFPFFPLKGILPSRLVMFCCSKEHNIPEHKHSISLSHFENQPLRISTRFQNWFYPVAKLYYYVFTWCFRSLKMSLVSFESRTCKILCTPTSAKRYHIKIESIGLRSFEKSRRATSC